MRTDGNTLTGSTPFGTAIFAAALAAALAAAPAGPLTAQVEGTAPPDAPAPAAPVVLEPGAVAAPATAAQEEVVRVGPVLRLRGDHTIEENQVVEGSVVVSGGDLHVRGHVQGDITVRGGSLHLYEGARVDGSAHVRGGTLRNAGAVVLGEMTATTATAAAAREAPRAPPRSRATTSVRTNRGWGSVADGLLGLVRTLALGLVLAVVGAALVFYALPQLNEVSDTVRRHRWRSAGIGLAATLLSLPVFLVGMAALFVTLIGIPLLLIYVPFYWVALFLATSFGVVAVAHALGERTLEQRGSYEPRYRNSYAYTFVGLGLILAPLVAADLIRMVGYLGFIGTMVGILASFLLWAASTVGLGAVLIVLAARWQERRRRRWEARARQGAAYDDAPERERPYARTGADDPVPGHDEDGFRG
jgi:hypothetical protein